MFSSKIAIKSSDFISSSTAANFLVLLDEKHPKPLKLTHMFNCLYTNILRQASPSHFVLNLLHKVLSKNVYLCFVTPKYSFPETLFFIHEGFGELQQKCNMTGLVKWSSSRSMSLHPFLFKQRWVVR